MILDDDKVKLGRVDSSSPSLDSSKSQYIIKGGGSGCTGYFENRSKIDGDRGKNRNCAPTLQKLPPVLQDILLICDHFNSINFCR